MPVEAQVPQDALDELSEARAQYEAAVARERAEAEAEAAPQAPDAPSEPEGKTEDAPEAPAPAETPSDDGTPDETPAETEAPDEPAPEEDAATELARVRQAHTVLTGKYRTEVPRYAQQVRELNERIRELEAKISTPAPAPASAPAAAADASNPYGLTDDEREIGTEAISAQEKIARAIAQQHARDVEERVRKEFTAKSRQEAFVTTLASMVPDWQQVNTSPEFLNWLGETDPTYGIVRQELLDGAHARGDGIRAANVFLAYKQASQPKPRAPQTPSLAAQVNPRTVTGQPSGPPKKTYTLAQWTEAMEALTNSEIGPEERDRKRQELTVAYREGRVR